MEENLKNIEDIKEILYPHFGRLDLFKKLSDHTPTEKLSILNEYIKNNKNIIKNSDIDVNSYTDYYYLVHDLHKIFSEQETRKFFISKLANPARNHIKDMDRDMLMKLSIIKKSEFKTRQFIRRSSIIKTKSDLIEYVNKIYNFDLSQQVEKIVEDKEVIRKGEYYFLKISFDNLDICPPAWCLYKNPANLIAYSRDYDMYFVYNEDTNEIGGLNIANGGIRGRGRADYYQNEMNGQDNNKLIVVLKAFKSKNGSDPIDEPKEKELDLAAVGVAIPQYHEEVNWGDNFMNGGVVDNNQIWMPAQNQPRPRNRVRANIPIGQRPNFMVRSMNSVGDFFDKIAKISLMDLIFKKGTDRFHSFWITFAVTVAFALIVLLGYYSGEALSPYIFK